MPLRQSIPPGHPPLPTFLRARRECTISSVIGLPVSSFRITFRSTSPPLASVTWRRRSDRACVCRKHHRTDWLWAGCSGLLLPFLPVSRTSPVPTVKQGRPLREPYLRLRHLRSSPKRSKTHIRITLLEWFPLPNKTRMEPRSTVTLPCCHHSSPQVRVWWIRCRSTRLLQLQLVPRCARVAGARQDLL